LSHALGKQFGDLTLAVCNSVRRKRPDVIDIAEYPSLVFVVSSAVLELSARGPLRVIRVVLDMSEICPVYPEQQTFLDPVGTSHFVPKGDIKTSCIA
jgi:hypothetical protein